MPDPPQHDTKKCPTCGVTDPADRLSVPWFAEPCDDPFHDTEKRLDQALNPKKEDE